MTEKKTVVKGAKDIERLMSEKEVAGILGIKPQTLSLWRHLNKGPAFMVVGDRVIRYRLSVIKSWLDSCVVNPK